MKPSSFDNKQKLEALASAALDEMEHIYLGFTNELDKTIEKYSPNLGKNNNIYVDLQLGQTDEAPDKQIEPLQSSSSSPRK